MKNLKYRMLTLLPVALPVALSAAQEPKPANKPNILIIMVDDMGYSDIGCYGSEIKTPNIDKLADNGMRFSKSNPSFTATEQKYQFRLCSNAYDIDLKSCASR